MVICPRCCEYFRFRELDHDRKTGRYLCHFTCDCPRVVRLEQSDAERKGFFREEEPRDMLHEKKCELIKRLMLERVPLPQLHMPTLVSAPLMSQ